MADEKAAEKPAGKKTTKKTTKAAKPTAARSAASKKVATEHVRTLAERGKGKKYLEAAKKVEDGKLYPADEAVKLVQDTSTTKFDGTVEVHIRLGLDARQAEQGVRGTVKLPAGTGKAVKVLAFVASAKQAAAKQAGADFVSDDATLKKVQDGWTGWDVTVASPDQMAEVGKLGKVLGPKGLMPNPKAGTVSDDPASAIAEVKKGTIEFRVAKDGTMHSGIGKVSFKTDDLLANLKAYFQAVQAAKPDDAKGTYIKTLSLASTMGPGIKVDLRSLR